MAVITRFEDLKVWQIARDLCKEIFVLVQHIPFAKDFELKSQINRSSGSVMDNIAEGFERDGNKEFRHFLYISKGSAGEVRSQLYRAYDRGYITQNQLDDFIQRYKELSTKIKNLITVLQNSELKGSKYKAT